MSLSEGDQYPVEKSAPLRKSLPTSLIAAGITAFLLIFLIGGKGRTTEALIAGLIFATIGGLFTFFILRTGRVNTSRLILFIGMGLFFTIAYTLDHQVNRGSILLTNSQIKNADVPICPITVPFVTPPLVIRGKMIFPATVKAFWSIGIFWLGFALLFGRGWCSWLCFFGGIDQTCAVAKKKPFLKMEGLSRIWRYFPYALLLFLILVALGFLYPLYCAWLCPLRIVYDPPAVNTTLEWLMAVVFIVGGMVFLIAGPFLTKKRLYCSLICPLLPAAAIIGRLSPFRIKVDREKCIDCGKCVKVCETFAMTKESVANGETTMECAKCGKCIDGCPKGAIDYRLIGTNIGVRPVFITLAVIFNLLIMSTFIMTLVDYFQTGGIRFH